MGVFFLRGIVSFVVLIESTVVFEAMHNLIISGGPSWPLGVNEVFFVPKYIHFHDFFGLFAVFEDVANVFQRVNLASHLFGIDGGQQIEHLLVQQQSLL
jgi:hypothetical protein